MAELVADRVKSGVLFALADEALDLPDAGEIIVEERVHRGGGAPLEAIAPVRRQRVPKSAPGQKREGNEPNQGQGGAEIKHHTEDNHELKDGYDSLFYSIDQHPLDRGHILEDAGHQIAGGAIIEPAQRQHLNVRVKITPEIEDHPLLKAVIENDADRIESVLDRESQGCDQDERGQTLWAVLIQDFIDDPLGHRRKHDHHEGAQDRASEGGRTHPRVPLQISKNAPDGVHRVER